MNVTAKAMPTLPGIDGLERLKAAKADGLEAEKARLKKAAKEFESFFMYQMLKTMRQTIPENTLTKDAPMSGGLGKETFTDMFDMEVARRSGFGGNQSIADLLYSSLVKQLEAKYVPDSDTGALKPLRPEAPEPIKIDDKPSISLPDKEPAAKPVERPTKMLPLKNAQVRVKSDPIREDFGKFIDEAAGETKLDSALITAVIRAESAGNPKAVSRAGAKGLMQLMDTTARDLEVSNVYDPRENIRAGSRYLAQMIERFGDVDQGLAAYNAGPGNVTKYGGIPPFAETKQYVARVKSYLTLSVGDEQAKDRH
ncbi:MAG: transglycosylase SLT domain-containing protein [candidate division Zixibacteria bacterium]|nr:transglycosylase SLT domain-containing protein [candidate division Zixibacteria bacterium]